MNRDINGFIDLNNFTLKCDEDLLIYTFIYNNEKYYFKTRDINKVYNELISEELANDYDINCVHYDIAKYNGEYGVLSKDFIQEKQFISMSMILKDVYHEIIKTNNIKDIKNALKMYEINNKFLKSYELNNIIDKLINVFMFDLLIANRDRHSNNLGLLIDNSHVDLAPLFDNEQLLNSYALFNNVFLLGIDKKIEFNFPILDYFFNTCDKKYLEKFKEKLWIIKEENINNVLTKIENRINSKINDKIKEEKIERFKINQKKILNNLN